MKFCRPKVHIQQLLHKISINERNKKSNLKDKYPCNICLSILPVCNHSFNFLKSIVNPKSII